MISRFLKYFILFFFIILSLCALGAAGNFLETFMQSSLRFRDFCLLCLYLTLGLIPVALCISTAPASFMSFRKVPPDTGLKGFFRKLGIGFICFIPLAIAVYLYDLYIQPSIQVKAGETLWELRNGSSIRGIDDKPMKTPGLKNLLPGLSTKEVLYATIDSLESECRQLKEQAGRFLSQLPDTASIQAYEAYELERLGIDYQYNPSPTLSGDSVIHLQQILLFNTAEQLHESNTRRLLYRYERTKRMMNSAALMLEFLFFAFLGYFSGKKPVQNILGIIAIIIVAGLFLNLMTAIGKRYANDLKNKSRDFERMIINKRYK